MPTLAGLQQLMEGHVWMGVNNSDPSMVWWAAMGFIFFSLADLAGLDPVPAFSKASDDGLNDTLCFVWIPHFDGVNARSFCWIVVPAGE